MSVIRIDSFGGEMPSASSRSILPGQARRAFNLLARVNEFRPLNRDVVKATKALFDAAGARFDVNGETLYRFTIDGNGNPYPDDTHGWVTAMPASNYTKGQINDSSRERLYVSSQDGAIAPIVIDATGVGKPLGVPPLTTAPSVTHNVVNEYSAEEANSAKSSVTIAMMDAFKAAKGAVAIGEAPGSAPASNYPGWLAHGASGVTGTLPTTENGDWAFCVPTTSGVLDFHEANYLTGSEFGGVSISYGGKTFWAVPVTLQGIGYTINESVLTDDLKAIQNPDPGAISPTVQAGYTNVGQLAPDANIAAVVANIVADFDQTATPQIASIAALNIARATFEKSVTDYANNTALAVQVTAFYGIDPGTGVTPSDEIDAAIANFAADIKAAENGIVNPTPIDYTASGGGGP